MIKNELSLEVETTVEGEVLLVVSRDVNKNFEIAIRTYNEAVDQFASAMTEISRDEMFSLVAHLVDILVPEMECTPRAVYDAERAALRALVACTDPLPQGIGLVLNDLRAAYHDHRLEAPTRTKETPL